MPTTIMPVVIGDYIKNTLHLTTEEHGAFFLMMMQCWMHGKIKNDKKTLKNLTKLSSKKLHNLLSFFDEKEGYLINAKINELKVQAIENKGRNQQRTAAATAARLAKTTDVTSDVTSHPASPSPSPSPKIDGRLITKPSELKYKTSHLSSAPADVLKKRFDILVLLKDNEITQAKKIKPDYDFYGYLVPTYNKFIRSDKGVIPDKPFMAFCGWIKNYIKASRH